MLNVYGWIILDSVEMEKRWLKSNLRKILYEI